MCGILFSAHFAGNANATPTGNTAWESLVGYNAKRGPDSQNSVHVSLSKDGVEHVDGDGQSSPRLSLGFFASELQLRGSSTVVQPHTLDGDILCWNGEIFDGMEISADENDGARLFQSLCSLDDPTRITEVFGGIEGPYAFVYYHKSTGRLFYARDPLGRRSLLIHKPTAQNPVLYIASVSAGGNLGDGFEEVLTESVHTIDLREWANGENLDVHLSSLPRCEIARFPFAQLSRVNATLPPEDYERVESLDQIPSSMVKVVDDLITELDRSVMLRVRDIPLTSLQPGQARVAVLFSGGIDSTVITYLAHRHLPCSEPIDLLNVAFENPRKMRLETEGNVNALPKQKKKERLKKGPTSEVKQPTYMVPDRVSGLQELEELRRLCPDRTWNFVEVNVPYEESQALRQEVSTLMLPGRTVMDMSLALALYFASRGIGQVRDSPDGHASPYHSRARVILNGLGSDELFGGYGRHRTAYTAGGWEAVIKELQLEVDRLPSRNLGRDDRIIAAHGKETRHPFLSLSVLNYATSLSVHLKMDPRLELGMGDKLLLRLAVRKLGLVEASCRKKRAMQFGSHSARMEGEKRGDLLLE
ncbi:hypothetical protein BDN72DRAFT_884541 [Pluteus cervinus]|uniref:Uncharacterized protein n=1 Tax=Pluteus cervinus TaxID=181527 RepID=A0ACD3BGL9_9AGAR|nr:hypothetical protein BDN72DRAFT_884541 [Pluteus cervinus]